MSKTNKNRNDKNRNYKNRNYKKNKTKKHSKLGRGKTVSKNRQLVSFLKQQGSLSYKYGDKTIQLKIDDDIVDKIDTILKKQYNELNNNKKQIIEQLQKIKDVFHELDEMYPGDFGDIYRNITRLEKMSFNEFTNDLLQERLQELDHIKQETIELIEIIIENEEMAESEMENYNSNTLENVQRILTQLN